MALTSVYTGADGTISLAVEGSPAQQGDFNAITAAYGETAFNPVGRVSDVEVCVQTELQEYYEIGHRETTRLLPGNVHISGKIGRAYMNGSLLFLLLGRGAKTDGLPTIQPRFVLNLALKHPTLPATLLRVNVFGVKFENWAMRVPQDTFVMEQLTFKAQSIGLVDNDEGTEINVAFPEAES
jgi:hypothetical protein